MKIKNYNLVLYSGGQQSSNHRLHGALSDLVGFKKVKSLTYIPYCFEGHQAYYNRFKKRYARFGFNDIHSFHADRPQTISNINRLLASDAIYLAGGNTYYMLYHLRKLGLVEKLRSYAQSGGVLSGLSAGAIIMTPDIDLAGYPEFDKDENYIRLAESESLNVVGFEFFPHFNQNNTRLVGALRRHAKKKDRLVIACHDGEGVVVANGEPFTVGSKVAVMNGQ